MGKKISPRHRYYKTYKKEMVSLCFVAPCSMEGVLAIFISESPVNRFHREEGSNSKVNENT